MSGHPSHPISRRSVLARSAAGAFSIVSPQAVRGSQANSKISVGLIGSGGRGTYDAGITHADPRARITALCDLYDDRIEQAKTALKLDQVDAYKDFEKLLASPSIDAVIIATPPFEHPRMLEAAVAAKKHVYCEKPAGVDVEGCQRVIRAGRRQDPKKVLSFGYQQRYGPVYLEAYKRLMDGAIGPLSTARGYWIANDPFTRRDYPGLDPKAAALRNWFTDRRYSGDIIVEQDCHNIDVLHWFLGGLPLKAIGYSVRKVRTNMDISDNLSVIFEWPGNMLVNFEANQLTPPGYRKVGEEFTGTKGTLLTSRSSMIHYKGPKDSETILSKRDITYEGIEQFLGRILSGDVENVAERSALSTMIAILGRTAYQDRKEVTWKGLFGTA
ncbi:MAG: Gfo/Idh/MocA family oxidoreductase [Candidatus Solibacter usitatus]|nr:Gfo/Idh/MocA family oxidoreductase [Candidatus Solibacter usitatus]